MTNQTTTNKPVVELNSFYHSIKMKRFDEAHKLTNVEVRRSAFKAVDHLPDVVNTSLTCDEVKTARYEDEMSPVTKALRESFVITSDYHLMRPLYTAYHGFDWDLPKKYQKKDYEMAKGRRRDLYDQLILNHERFSDEGANNND